MKRGTRRVPRYASSAIRLYATTTALPPASTTDRGKGNGKIQQRLRVARRRMSSLAVPRARPWRPRQSAIVPAICTRHAHGDHGKACSLCPARTHALTLLSSGNPRNPMKGAREKALPRRLGFTVISRRLPGRSPMAGGSDIPRLRRPRNLTTL